MHNFLDCLNTFFWHTENSQKCCSLTKRIRFTQIVWIFFPAFFIHSKSPKNCEIFFLPEKKIFCFKSCETYSQFLGTIRVHYGIPKGRRERALCGATSIHYYVISVVTPILTPSAIVLVTYCLYILPVEYIFPAQKKCIQRKKFIRT